MARFNVIIAAGFMYVYYLMAPAKMWLNCPNVAAFGPSHPKFRSNCPNCL